MREYPHTSMEPKVESPQPTFYTTGNLGDIATKANVLFALVVVAAVYFDQGSAVAAVIAGAAYYGITNITTLLILSGTLTQTFVALQHHITLRRLHHLQLQAPPPIEPAITVVDLPQLESRGSAAPLPPPGLPLAKSYVPPTIQSSDIDEATRREAIAWTMQLYGQDGQPDPKKILLKTDKETPGRVKIAAPNRVAKRYLLERGVLRAIDGNGYRLNLTRCPTITAAQNRLR